MFAALEIDLFYFFHFFAICLLLKKFGAPWYYFSRSLKYFSGTKIFCHWHFYELDKNSICCVHQNKTFLFGNLANGPSWPVAGDFIEQWNLVESLHFCPAFSLIHKLRHFMPFFLFFSKQTRVGLQHYFKVTFVHTYAFTRFFCLRVLEWNQCCGM